jgi:hypothetical protein
MDPKKIIFRIEAPVSLLFFKVTYGGCNKVRLSCASKMLWHKFAPHAVSASTLFSSGLWRYHINYLVGTDECAPLGDGSTAYTQ